MIKSDKEELFKELIKQHNDQIHRICWGFIENTEDVKDMVQDVLINIWKGLDGFKNKSSYSTWIHRITINTCLLWKKKTTYFNQSKTINSPVAESNYYETQFEGDIRSLHMKKAINKLKPIDKTIILLILEEVSHKDISSITGLSTSNVGVKVLIMNLHLFTLSV